MIFPGWKTTRKTTRKPEPGKNFWVQTRNPEKFPGSNPEPGKISRFQPGTRKNFRVPTRNSENSEFRVPEISGLFPGFSALFSNPEKSLIFRVFPGWNPEPGIPMETLLGSSCVQSTYIFSPS